VLLHRVGEAYSQRPSEIMQIDDPRDAFDFDCAVLLVANRIIKDGPTKTPGQELEDLKNQFRAAGGEVNG